MLYYTNLDGYIAHQKHDLRDIKNETSHFCTVYILVLQK